MGSGSSLESQNNTSAKNHDDKKHRKKSVRNLVKDELREIDKSNIDQSTEDSLEPKSDETVRKDDVTSYKLVNGKRTLVINPSVFKARRLFMNHNKNNSTEVKKLVIKKQVSRFFFFTFLSKTVQ